MKGLKEMFTKNDVRFAACVLLLCMIVVALWEIADAIHLKTYNTYTGACDVSLKDAGSGSIVKDMPGPSVEGDIKPSADREPITITDIK